MTRIADLLADVRHAVSELERWTPDLEHPPGRQLRAWPANTRPGTGSTPGGHPDPTLDAIIGAENSTDLSPLIEELTAARTHLAVALGHTTRNLPRIHDNQIHGTPDQPQGEPGCTSCARIGQWMPQKERAGGLCAWCYRYRLAEKGQLPPIPILEKHHRGERISQRDLAMAKVATQRRARRKNR